MVLCRDARDGFDKLALDARKTAVEGAKRQWDSRTSLAVSLANQRSIDDNSSTITSAVATNSTAATDDDCLIPIKSEDKIDNKGELNSTIDKINISDGAHLVNVENKCPALKNIIKSEFSMDVEECSLTAASIPHHSIAPTSTFIPTPIPFPISTPMTTIVPISTLLSESKTVVTALPVSVHASVPVSIPVAVSVPMSVPVSVRMSMKFEDMPISASRIENPFSRYESY